MKARMFVQYCLNSAISVSLVGVFCGSATADDDFLPQSQMVTTYSKSLTISSEHYLPTMHFPSHFYDRGVSMRLNRSSSSTQDKAGVGAYKFVTTSKKKLGQQATGAALLYGVQMLGFGTQVNNGINFLKEVRRFEFGECSHVRFSTKKLKAQSCFSDQAKIEFKSSYKLDSFSLNFKWAL